MADESNQNLNDTQVSYEEFINDLSNNLGQLETIEKKLDQAYVYDDVAEVMAYVPQLAGAAKNSKLGDTPKSRLKRLYDMTKKLFHDLKDIFIKPIIFNDVIPENKKNEALIVLALSGRTKEQCEEISNNPEKLRIALYFLIDACEAAAYGADNDGNILTSRSEAYLLSKYAQARKIEREGDLYESVINSLNNNDSTRAEDIRGISSDIEI